MKYCENLNDRSIGFNCSDVSFWKMIEGAEKFGGPPEFVETESNGFYFLELSDEQSKKLALALEESMPDMHPTSLAREFTEFCKKGRWNVNCE